MSHTTLRVVSALSSKPATRTELADACCTTKSSVNKIVATLQQRGQVVVIGHKTHVGWRGGRTPVPVYAMKDAA